MSLVRTTARAALSFLALLALGTTVATAQLRPPEKSGLRGAPFPSGNPPPDLRSFGDGPDWDGKAPPGIEPLALDLFKSKDFYKDRGSWLDARYWRCNSPRQIADMRSGGAGAGTSDPRIGRNPPLSARWGDCAKDWPRENIVSPYEFATAAEHYAALLSGREVARRSHEIHLRDDAALGRCVRRVLTGRPARLELRPRDAGADVLVAAHARVSAAHGAAALSRRRRRGASVVGVVLLARGFHAPVGDGPEAAAHRDEPRRRRVPGQRQRQHRAHGAPRPRASRWAKTSRSGTAIRSHSGTATR